MPKTEIDYSNTIIYKISCKDETIKDLYVGHTTNFVQRKHAHKQACINEKSESYPCKLYKKIRENGGWDNWTMEIIDFFNCKDHYEARVKEQEYFTLLNASLNTLEPFPKPKTKEKVENMDILVCDPCKIPLQSSKLTNIDNNKFVPNDSSNFICEKCNYYTSRKSQYIRHIETEKHKLQNSTTSLQQNVRYHNCSTCGKNYKHHSSLYKHKQNCIKDDSLLQFLIQENKDLKKIVFDIYKQIQPSNIN